MTTLAGRNLITSDLPGLGTATNRLNSTRLNFEAKPGDNTFNAGLPAK